MNLRGVNVLLSFMLMLSFGAYSAHAAETSSGVLTDASVADTLPAAPVVKKRTEAEEKQIIEKRKRVTDKQMDLNGSSWDVAYSSSTDPKQKGKKDLFTFQNGQFNSKELIDRGFTWTNYTISVPNEESELAVWETMQTGEEGIVFIHGEWIKDKMTGHITEQLDGGKVVIEHSFSTSNRETIPDTTEESESAAQDALLPTNALETTQGASGVLVSKEAEVVMPVDEVNKKIDMLAKSITADQVPAAKKPAVAAFEPGTTQEKI